MYVCMPATPPTAGASSAFILFTASSSVSGVVLIQVPNQVYCPLYLFLLHQMVLCYVPGHLALSNHTKTSLIQNPYAIHNLLKIAYFICRQTSLSTVSCKNILGHAVLDELDNFYIGIVSPLAYLIRKMSSRLNMNENSGTEYERKKPEMLFLKMTYTALHCCVVWDDETSPYI